MTVFDVGHQFLAMTDRLALSPAEYQLLSEWDAAGVPASVVQAGVAERVARCRGDQQRRRLKLTYCREDVEAVADEWRRAIGPRYAALQEQQ